MIISGIVFLKEAKIYDLCGIKDELEMNWNLDINYIDYKNDNTVIIGVEDCDVEISYFSEPIKEKECIEEIAEKNFSWENGALEISKHKAYISVAITDSDNDIETDNLLFTFIVSSILNNSNSIGIYLSDRDLTLKKEFYLMNLELLKEGKIDLPIYNWIYFGAKEENGKYSLFTYGLYIFGKKEIEILNSEKPFDDIMEVLYELVNYVICSDIELEYENFLDISETGEKLKISESPAVFSKGITIKIKY